MLSGLSKVLDLIQTVLKDGSMYLDYRGQTECRSFVLEQAGVYFLKRWQLEYGTLIIRYVVSVKVYLSYRLIKG